MKNWTTLLLQFDSFIFKLKTKLAEEKHGLLIFVWGLLIIISILIQTILALPLYIFLTLSTLKKQGATDTEIKVFVLKRKVTFSAVALFLLIIFIKLFFAGAVLSFLFPSKKVAAANVAWGFANPADYVYDAGQIQIVDGMALFKATNPASPTPTLPLETVTPTATLIETIVSQAPTAIPTIIPTVAVTEVPAPTTAPIPAIETATPIPQPTIAPAAPAPQTEQQNAPAAPPPVEAPAAPVLGTSTSCTATIQPVHSLTVDTLDHWTSFSQSASNTGNILYQLSDDDGQTWKYWNGTSWTGGNSWNSAADITAHIALFPATGKLLFRAKLENDCTQDMQLLGVTAEYDTKTISTPTLIPSATPTPTTTPVVQMQINLSSPTVLPSLTVTSLPTVVPTVESIPTPTPTSGNILENILSSIGELFTGAPSITPTPEIIVPTPTIAVTAPIATASSNLTETNVTIQQPVSLIAPTTIETNVSDVNATVTIPGSQGYNLPNIFSISGAFNINALGTSTQIVAKEGSYSFGTSSDGKNLVLTLTTTTGETETIDALLPNITADQVNVAIATYDGTVVKLYLNGTLIGTKNLQATVATSENTVKIGEGNILTAQVNPFVLYNTVLTPEEIALRYLQVNNFPAELVITGIEQIGNGDVKITYKLVDQNSHVLALDVYEYSTTGAFSGEQHVMT